MRLVPFHKSYADSIRNIYSDDSYSSFTRGVCRYLTQEECENLPHVLGQEVLIVYSENEIMSFGGVVTLLEEPGKVFKWGMAIVSREQGIGSKVQELIEEYCVNVRGARVLITETLGHQLHLGNHLEKTGYKKAGVIPSLAFVMGKLEDVSIYYKNKET